MRWIIDAQLPPALCGFLEFYGHQAEHVMALGMGDASDSVIWDYALEYEAVIITKDEDFQIRVLAAQEVPSIVWLRVGNCSRHALMQWLEPLRTTVEDRLKAGEKLIEIR